MPPGTVRGREMTATPVPASRPVGEVLQRHQTLVQQQQKMVAEQAELVARQEATADRLKELGQLVQAQQKVVAAQVELAHRQEATIEQLKQITIEVNGALRQLVSEFDMLEPRNSWHARLIDHNHSAYTSIGNMLGGLDERVFPTRRTWYGKSWRRLTAPFQVGQFPTLEQRDELVRLLDRIVANERRRVSILASLPVQQCDPGDIAPGHCLGTEWKTFRDHLVQLKVSGAVFRRASRGTGDSDSRRPRCRSCAAPSTGGENRPALRSR